MSDPEAILETAETVVAVLCSLVPTEILALAHSTAQAGQIP